MSFSVHVAIYELVSLGASMVIDIPTNRSTRSVRGDGVMLWIIFRVDSGNAAHARDLRIS